MAIEQRRESFCGKMSVCNNLRQYGIRYSLTTQHTSDPETRPSRWTASIRCHMPARKGLRRARIGLIGARPANFTTVRFSEKLLERAGISVETLDLSDVFGRIDRLRAGDTRSGQAAGNRALQRTRGVSRSGNDEDGQARYRDRPVAGGQPA